MVDHPVEPTRARVSGYDTTVDGALWAGPRPGRMIDCLDVVDVVDDLT
jgi:hypothetical protein